jgi:uncharacterized membrane protein YhaH (DUF805 family)
VDSRYWQRLLALEGRIRRGPYLLLALALVALKFVVDSSVAAHFGQPWHIWYYVAPPTSLKIFGLSGLFRRMYLILWAIALPFFWIGLSLTVRRLRDAGLNFRWVILFFVPVANFLLFLYLSIVPSAPLSSASEIPSIDPPARPSSAPIWAVLIASTLGVGLVYFSTGVLARYAWSLFLGVPFVIGFLTSWIFNYQVLHSRKQTIILCCVTPLIIGFALIGFRMEGLICLAMALPLALPISIAGGVFAYSCRTGGTRPFSPPRVTACIALLPALMFAEHHFDFQPPTEPVVTTVIIHAPVSVVWRNVIAFPELAPPTEFLFRTGIAYPIGATIDGSGPGAVRRCRFSTGDFVEPITTWEPNHLLAFSVAAEPPSLREIGFGPIHSTHIDRNYMRSRHGQFRLVALDPTHTLLEGTTWYQDYFWPQVYWRPISDAIVHRIHDRVLEHVRRQSEMQAQLSNLQ